MLVSATVPSDVTLLSNSKNNELFIINLATVQADEYLLSRLRKAVPLPASNSDTLISQAMIYKTSLGNWTKGITIIVTVVFAFIIIKQYSIIKDAGKANPIYTTVTLLVIYFIAFVFRPVYYKITNDKLIIHRLITDVRIDRQNIRTVELIDKNKISWSLRTFGVGGLFGMCKYPRYRRIGNVGSLDYKDCQLGVICYW